MMALINLLRDLAPIGAVAVFAVALWQYMRSEAWKRTEFVANLYKEFSENEDCKRALAMFLGHKRKLYYKAGESLVSYNYNFDALKAALDAAVANVDLKPPQLHICETLDSFCVYIEQFDRAIQRGLVSPRDVYPYFGYWIALLNGDPKISPPKPVLKSIQEYIDAAGFDDVQSFLGRKWDEVCQSLMVRMVRCCWRLNGSKRH